LATWDGPEVSEIATSACSTVKVGFFGWCSVRLGRQPAHDMLRMFALASLFSPNARFMDYAYPIPLRGRARSRRHGETRVLVVHGDTRPEKMWPVSRYDQVLSPF